MAENGGNAGSSGIGAPRCLAAGCCELRVAVACCVNYVALF